MASGLPQSVIQCCTLMRMLGIERDDLFKNVEHGAVAATVFAEVQQSGAVGQAVMKAKLGDAAPHVVAQLLIMLLWSDNLLPLDKSAKLQALVARMRAAGGADTGALQEALELLSQVPPMNRVALSHLLDLLGDVAEFQTGRDRASATHLANVFGPPLLRGSAPASNADTITALVEFRHELKLSMARHKAAQPNDRSSSSSSQQSPPAVTSTRGPSALAGPTTIASASLVAAPMLDDDDDALGSPSPYGGSAPVASAPVASAPVASAPVASAPPRSEQGTAASAPPIGWGGGGTGGPGRGIAVASDATAWGALAMPGAEESTSASAPAYPTIAAATTTTSNLFGGSSLYRTADATNTTHLGAPPGSTAGATPAPIAQAELVIPTTEDDLPVATATVSTAEDNLPVATATALDSTTASVGELSTADHLRQMNRLEARVQAALLGETEECRRQRAARELARQERVKEREARRDRLADATEQRKRERALRREQREAERLRSREARSNEVSSSVELAIPGSRK